MTAPLQIPLVRLPHGMDLALPGYATEKSAGADLLAAVDDPVILNPGKRAVVPTGISIALPEGFEAQVRGRSGLAAKYGVTVLNSPGTIDADYRGEICVILINHGDQPFTIKRGMRVAQLVIVSVRAAVWHETDDLEQSARGACGFGSTGTQG